MLTENGIKTYELFDTFGLGEFYNPHMGNALIPVNVLDIVVLSKVNALLLNNTNFVMGYEEGYMFITERDNLY